MTEAMRDNGPVICPRCEGAGNELHNGYGQGCHLRWPVPSELINATDLRAVAEAEPCTAYRVIVFRDGCRVGDWAEAVITDSGRIGLAWVADTHWLDVPAPAAGIDPVEAAIMHALTAEDED